MHRPVAVRAGGFVLPLLLMLAGCGETKQEVIRRYAPDCARMSETLRRIAANLPPRGDPRAEQAAEGLDPPPIYDEKSKTGNVEFLMEEHLTDPQAKCELDLYLSRHLDTCLAWAGPNSPLAESAQASAAGTIEDDFRAALGWEYLVVVRVASYEPPVIVGQDQFQGGAATLDVFVVRRGETNPTAAFRVAAKPADSVSYSHKASESAASRAGAFVHSSVWSDARRKLAAGLEKTTGGKFTFE